MSEAGNTKYESVAKAFAKSLKNSFPNNAPLRDSVIKCVKRSEQWVSLGPPSKRQKTWFTPPQYQQPYPQPFTPLMQPTNLYPAQSTVQMMAMQPQAPATAQAAPAAQMMPPTAQPSLQTSPSMIQPVIHPGYTEACRFCTLKGSPQQTCWTLYPNLRPQKA